MPVPPMIQPVGRNHAEDAMPKYHLPTPAHLLSATKTQHQVQRRLFLNVVVGERSAVLELFASEDKTLLVRRDTLLILDLRLYVVDGV